MQERDENFGSETENGRSKKEAFDTIVLALKDKESVNILFVCSANICRSPYAEMRFEQLMKASSSTSSVGLTPTSIAVKRSLRTLVAVGGQGWRPDSGVNRRAQVLASVGDVTRWR